MTGDWVYPHPSGRVIVTSVSLRDDDGNVIGPIWKAVARQEGRPIPEGVSFDAMQAAVVRWVDARVARDFPTADATRDELLAGGWKLRVSK